MPKTQQQDHSYLFPLARAPTPLPPAAAAALAAPSSSSTKHSDVHIPKKSFWNEARTRSERGANEVRTRSEGDPHVPRTLYCLSCWRNTRNLTSTNLVKESSWNAILLSTRGRVLLQEMRTIGGQKVRTERECITASALKQLTQAFLHESGLSIYKFPFIVTWVFQTNCCFNMLHIAVQMHSCN